MPRWQRTYLASTAAVISGALLYMLSDFGGWTRLVYLPYDRSWRFADSMPDPSASVYPGLCLWAAGGALLAFAAVWALAGRREKPVSARSLHLAGGWALTAFALTGCYFTWNLWPF